MNLKLDCGVLSKFTEKKCISTKVTIGSGQYDISVKYPSMVEVNQTTSQGSSTAAGSHHCYPRYPCSSSLRHHAHHAHKSPSTSRYLGPLGSLGQVWGKSGASLGRSWVMGSGAPPDIFNLDAIIPIILSAI
jgi:hypothetical protein